VTVSLMLLARVHFVAVFVGDEELIAGAGCPLSLAMIIIVVFSLLFCDWSSSHCCTAEMSNDSEVFKTA